MFDDLLIDAFDLDHDGELDSKEWAMSVEVLSGGYDEEEDDDEDDFDF